MSEDSDNRADQADPSRDRRLEDLAESLGLRLPPFAGPLDAFELGDDRRPGDRIYLGGDLHAIHPDAADRRPLGARDHSLDSATIIIDDLEQESSETVAVEGVWCLPVRDDLLASAPYFTLWDTQGHIRAWLILPPPRTMIGLGHFWLPRVSPLPDPRSTA
jgi:hypothetical protein